MLNGTGVKKIERIYGASILDVTPTILDTVRTADQTDMDGNVLVNVFEERSFRIKIPGRESSCWIRSNILPINRKIHMPPWHEAMEQLIELDISNAPTRILKKAIKSTVGENDNYYLARLVLYAWPQIHEAIWRSRTKLFEKIPPPPRYGMQLALCLKAPTMWPGHTTGALSKIKEVNKWQRVGRYEDHGEFTPDRKQAEGCHGLFEQIEKAGTWQYATRSLLRPSNAGKKKPCSPKNWNTIRVMPAAYHGVGVTLLRRKKCNMSRSTISSTQSDLLLPVCALSPRWSIVYAGDYERSAEAFEVCLKNPGN